MPRWNPTLSSFGDVHPELVREFSWLENPDHDPYSVAPGSTFKAMWRCAAHGHPRVREFYLEARGGRCEACFSLALVHPSIAAQWHPTLNGDVTPSDVAAGTMKKYWWICEEGHPWLSSCANRTKPKGAVTCGVCAGKQVLAGYNDIASQRPEYAAQLHPIKNSLRPEEILANGGKLVWWQCELGHEWEQAPNRRHLARCPVCAGRILIPGMSDLATTNPELAAEWHPTRNSKQPTEITRKNVNPFWWLGTCGHEWEGRVYDRVHTGTGCHFCGKHAVLTGFNDLATTDPNLLPLWDPANVIKPSEVSRGSNRRVGWIGPCGHLWEAAIREVVLHDTRCPFCGGNKVLSGFNDLLTIAPELAKEWHPTKNGDRRPETTMAEGKGKIWWLGVCGHEWQAVVPPRIHRGIGCPKCSNSVSKAETRLYEALLTFFPDAEQTARIPAPGMTRSNRFVVDSLILHAGRAIAVEYDGVYWHTPKFKQDAKKTKALLELGLRVVRLREDALEPLDLTHPDLLQFNFKHDGDPLSASKVIEQWIISG